MVGYAIEVSPDDNGTLLITSPRLPVVTSFAERREDVESIAVDAIETALASMIDDGEKIPRPDENGMVIALPALTVLKLHLYWALQEAGMTRAELGRRLGWKRESVDRLFRLHHRSRLEQIEAALAELGRRVEIDVKDAA